MKKGHLDAILRKAVGLGMRIEDAVYCATYTPARRMGLNDRGVIAPGKLADFILSDEIEGLINLDGSPAAAVSDEMIKQAADELDKEAGSMKIMKIMMKLRF